MTAPKLTRRQREVLALTFDGLATAEIADRLHMRPESVRCHRYRIYQQFGVHAGPLAVMAAIRLGLIPAPPVDTRQQVVVGLTPRQHQTLRLIAGGLTHTEIAAALHISFETAKTYAHRIYHQMHVEDRLQATIVGLRLSLVDAPAVEGGPNA